jgi:hypothetical protein
MPKVARYALRFVIVITIVASASLLLPPSTFTDTPYYTALSNLAFGTQTVAAGVCDNVQCTKGLTCVFTGNPFNCKIKGNHCTATAC